MIRRLLLLDHPNETRFFVFIGLFGIVLAAIYWVLTYEVAGTVLLAGFGIGTGLLGVVLFRSRPRAMALAAKRRRSPTTDAGRDAVRTGDAIGPDDGLDDGPARGPEQAEAPATPFDDPMGRLPGETLAPLALGLGTAMAITAVVFGPWLLVAGMVPFAWGAWTWLAGARDELDATVEDDLRRGLPAPGRRDAGDSGTPAPDAPLARPEP